MTEHHPGPWEVSDLTDIVCDTRGIEKRIASCSTARLGNEIAEANAALIAAAPDTAAERDQLRATVTELVEAAGDVLGGNVKYSIACRELRAAIERAKGES